MKPTEAGSETKTLWGRWYRSTKGGEVKNVSVLVAIGVAQTGYRQILAVSEGAKEDKVSWTTFLRELKERGLKAVKLFVSDKCLGLVENRIVVWNLIEDWWLSFYVRISGNRKLLCAIAFHRTPTAS